MKEFFEKLMSSEDGQHYTKNEIIVYGVLVPLALVLIMGLAGWIESLSL